MDPVTRVKICGITRLEDAELAASLGAWALGFILWPQSKRAVEEAVAAGIARRVRRQVELVGVFVNPTLDEVAHAVDAIGLTHVQLHGDEGPVVRQRGRRAARARRSSRPRASPAPPTCRRWSASAPTSTCSTPPSRACAAAPGSSWDWSLAAQRRSKIPMILAGGLTAENVADGDRRGAAVRGRRRLRRRGRAGHQGPRQARGVPGDRRARAGGHLVSGRVPSSTASGPTAASTCRRR